MIYSMTGYGSASGFVGKLAVTIELKSVNNRYLDVSVRMPRNYIFAEEGIKAQVQKHISRGKVDVFLSVDSSKSDDVVITINEALAKSYVVALRSLCKQFNVTDDISATAIGKMPDVLSAEKKEEDKDVFSAGIAMVLENALNAFDAMRKREGDKLHDDIINRLDAVEQMTAQIEKRSPETVAEYRAKLEQRMREVLETVDIDDTRLMTEAAIFADRIAVDEETVRLHSHIAQLRDMLKNGSPAGRKLDFLIQELNRETNTVGSKCNDHEITKVVIDMKAEIEKIREQVQNIE
ncbi:MAG: YicC/YloC family endoribonuclease [Oscillospiraceae bacterium]